MPQLIDLSKINSFLAKLSKKEKAIASIAIVFIVLALFDRFMLNTILVKISSIDENVKTQELLIKKGLRVLAQKDAILKQLKAYSVYDVDAKTQEEEMAGLLKSLEVTSGKSSVIVTEVKLADFKLEKIKKEYFISLSCDGTMEQLVNFIFNLEHSKDLFTVENYSLTSKDKEKGIVHCIMSISKTFIVP